MTNLLKTFLLLVLLTSELFSQQSRAIWIVRDALNSQNISNIISDVKKLKCDKVFLQLRALGNVYYPTHYDIPYKKVDQEKLKTLFRLAKENNIDVHIWLNICYIETNNANPSAPNHILNKSKNSIIYSPRNGVDSEGYFLHPNDKTNLSEVKNIIIELLDNYEFKGIHLDYFRYPKDIDHYSNTGRTHYILKTGLDPIFPISNPELFINERGLDSYTYFKEDYGEFLRNELTESLKQIRNYCRSLNKELQLSVAVKPNLIKAKHQFYQDWKYWLENDLCDFVVIMNYSPNMEVFTENIKIVLNEMSPKKIIIGIGAYNIGTEELISRIKFAQNTTFNGYCIFSYNYIVKNKWLLNQLVDTAIGN